MISDTLFEHPCLKPEALKCLVNKGVACLFSFDLVNDSEPQGIGFPTVADQCRIVVNPLLDNIPVPLCAMFSTDGIQIVQIVQMVEQQLVTIFVVPAFPLGDRNVLIENAKLTGTDRRLPFFDGRNPIPDPISAIVFDRCADSVWFEPQKNPLPYLANLQVT